jgi:hypothetical protein
MTETPVTLDNLPKDILSQARKVSAMVWKAVMNDEMAHRTLSGKEDESLSVTVAWLAISCERHSPGPPVQLPQGEEPQPFDAWWEHTP